MPAPREDPAVAREVTTTTTVEKCQIPNARGRPCNRPLTKLNDWTWECEYHGEVH